MFDCPFFYKLPIGLATSDNLVQEYLNEWRIKEGDSWLDTIGPILKAREIRNMERLKVASKT